MNLTSGNSVTKTNERKLTSFGSSAVFFLPAILFIQGASSMPRLLLRILRMFPRMMLRCSEVTMVQHWAPGGEFSGPFSHQ